MEIMLQRSNAIEDFKVNVGLQVIEAILNPRDVSVNMVRKVIEVMVSRWEKKG